MKTIRDLILASRGTGNTSWIIKSCIKSPECIVIVRTKQQAYSLSKLYRKQLYNCFWLKRVWRRYFRKTYPLFTQRDVSLEGYRRPVIFDNSALLD